MATEIKSSTSEIPAWLAPYVSGTPSTGTPGSADYNPGSVGLLDMATANINAPNAAYTTSRTDAINGVGNRIANLNPMQTNALNATGSMQPSALVGQGAGLMGMGGSGTYNTEMAQRYMDPYMQQVVDQQKKSAVADYQRQMPTLQSQAFQAGAGRGTRSALMQSEANRNLQNNLQNIQAQGLQNAWQQGQGQFNTEANRQIQAGQGLGALGQTDFNQRMGINAAQQAAGATYQGQEQNQLTTAYEDYLAKQREPYQKLGWYSDILNGIPASANTSMMYTPSARPNIAGQTAGLLASGLGYLGGASASK
jgi:hypothetical protein